MVHLCPTGNASPGGLCVHQSNICSGSFSEIDQTGTVWVMWPNCPRPVAYNPPPHQGPVCCDGKPVAFRSHGLWKKSNFPRMVVVKSWLRWIPRLTWIVIQKWDLNSKTPMGTQLNSVSSFSDTQKQYTTNTYQYQLVFEDWLKSWQQPKVQNQSPTVSTGLKSGASNMDRRAPGSQRTTCWVAVCRAPWFIRWDHNRWIKLYFSVTWVSGFDISNHTINKYS